MVQHYENHATIEYMRTVEIDLPGIKVQKTKQAVKLAKKDAEGFYRIPYLNGNDDGQYFVCRYNQHILKFKGAYVLRILRGRLVYWFSQQRDEILRLRDLRRRQKALLKQYEEE